VSSLTWGQELTRELEESHPQVVVLLRLISESEETEEDERADDRTPSRELKRAEYYRVVLIGGPWVIVDGLGFRVGISPGDPWVNHIHGTVHDDEPKGHRDGDTEIDGS